MFKRTKEKPRVFLGTLAVVDKKDWKRFFENLVWVPNDDLQSNLHRQLEQLFALAPVESKHNHRQQDLGLDIILLGTNSGDGVLVEVVPVFWRPRVHIKARLYHIHTDKTLDVFEVIETASWREFLGRYFSWGALFGFKDVFRTQDLMVLVNRASSKILEQVVKASYKHG